MYPQIHALLSDKKGGEIFTCFGAWHLGYILATLAVTALVCVLIKNRGREAQRKTAVAFINLAFGMYIADFFLMPFAYEEIDIEKLPFHICTAMCVMCFLSRHTRLFAPYRMQLALLGFISNLVYLIYPAGVMWHAVHPLCYRVVQTLLFHGVMTAYGILTLLFDEEGLSFRTWRKHLLTVVAMTLWAMLGNLLYTGAAGRYDHNFNWFFVTADPFGMLDKRVAPYIMPVLNIAVFFAVELLLCAVFQKLRKPAAEKSKI